MARCEESGLIKIETLSTKSGAVQPRHPIPNPMTNHGIDLDHPGQPAPPERDLYGYRHRAAGVVELLGRCPRPFVVSIEGEWGRGKSTFLRMVLEALEHPSDSEAARWEVVQYHPWRYNLVDFDDTWESMVEVIAQGLSPTSARAGQLNELLAKVGESRLLRLVWRTGSLLPLAREGLAALGDAASAVREALVRPERLGRRYLLFEEVRATLEEFSRDRQVLLVIDDLDRCEPHVVAQVLRCLPTLFAPPDGPKFAILLALDRGATVRALERSQGWAPDYANGFLDKVIQVHVTLPVLQLGDGDRKHAGERLVAALTGGGYRRPRQEPLPLDPAHTAEFSFPADRLATIGSFMHHNPRELERFCLLFDLKWASRYEPNLQAKIASLGPKPKLDFQAWLDEFRDRLTWESIVELRWPLYDAKPADIEANKRAISSAIAGDLEAAKGLPCERYLVDLDFLEIHRRYFSGDWTAPPLEGSATTP